jgi:hypothetical protein
LIYLKNDLVIKKNIKNEGYFMNNIKEIVKIVLFLGLVSGQNYVFAMKPDAEFVVNEKQVALDPSLSLANAVEVDDFDWIQKHIENGADINGKDSDGFTPLQIQIHTGNFAILKWLVEHGADVNQVCHCCGETPLQDAACYAGESDWGYLAKDLVTLLLQHGAKVDAKNENGETAFYIAMKNERLDIAQMLENAGADVNVILKNGKNVLYAVVESGKPELVHAALSRSVAYHCADNMGITPLYLAVSKAEDAKVQARYGCVEIVKMLVDAYKKDMVYWPLMLGDVCLEVMRYKQHYKLPKKLVERITALGC